MTLNSSDRSWDSWLVRRNCWKRRLSECETSSWRIPYSCRKIGYKPSRLLGVWRLVSISRFFRLNVLFNRIKRLYKVTHLPIVPFLTTDCLVIDRRWRLRVVRTNKRYAKCSQVCQWYSSHISTSPVIYFWTDPRKLDYKMTNLIHFVSHTKLNFKNEKNFKKITTGSW